MGQGASRMTCGYQRIPNEEEEELCDNGRAPFVQTQLFEIDYTTWLPDECFAFIFLKMSTLDRKQCSLVCKRWHRVEAQSRQRLSLRAHADIILFLPDIFSRFDRITKLSLRADRKTTSISDKALVLVGQHCTHLAKLKIKGCKQLTDDGVELFAKLRGNTLRKLSCGSCSFGAQGINAIVQNCPFLEDLTVKRLRGLVDGPAELIGPGGGTIHRLCLKDLFNAQLFVPLIASCKNLRTLMICRSPGNWDKLLEIVTEQVKNLVELHIERLMLSDRGLQAISRWARLEVFYVVKTPDCTNAGLAAIADGCKQIRKLHVDGWKPNPRIGDEGLTALALNCRDLQEVVLIGINATAESLGLMASNCMGLERLALCNSETMGDAELSCIAERCRALKRLCIKGCAISDEGMKALATGCPRLVKVKVKKCRGVTWQSAAWLQLHRPQLTLSLDCEAPATEMPEITRVEEQEVLQTQLEPAAPSPKGRSSFTKVKIALIASGSFVACSLLRLASSRGS